MPSTFLSMILITFGNESVDYALFKSNNKSLTMEKWAVFFRYLARFILLSVSIMVFGFAFVSGANMDDGIISGIIENSPNVLPRLLLLGLTVLAWKYELIGGLVITCLGVYLIYFFNFSEPNFLISTFNLSLLITILGLFFVVSWAIRRKLN